MKTSLGLVAALSPFLIGGVAHADCPPGSFVVTSSGGDYGVTFDQMLATQSTPAVCSPLKVHTGSPAGTVTVYSADYRGGFMDPDATGRLTVGHNGVMESSTAIADPLIPGDFFYTHFIGTNSTGDLESSIELELLQSATLADTATLDSVDYHAVASAKLTDIQDSVDHLSTAHTSLITHLNATADLLTGAGQKFEQQDGVAALGGVGSFTLGATGRRSLDGGFTLLGGAALFNQSVGGASASGLLFSGSLRFVEPSGGLVRPYGELGLVTAPVMGVSFTRSYATSTGTTTATGTATAGLYGGFIKGGALITPDENNEVVASATFSKDWLLTGAYSETFSGSNLFAASAPAQTSSFDTAKIGVDWTTKVMPRVDVTLSGAVGATIAENPVATDVMFAGAFSGAPRSELFGEYGARVAYEIDPSQSISAFIHGSMGQYSGSHVQVGGDFHVRF